jgi:hypothetical protein
MCPKAGQPDRPDRHRLGHVHVNEHMLLVPLQKHPLGTQMAAMVREPVV